MDDARSFTVRLDAAGPELTPRTLSTQLGRIRKGELNTVLATVTALEPPQPAITAVNEWWKIDRALDRGARVATSVEQIRQRPMIVSHGNARAVCDSPRNFSDDVIRAVAATGGVIGLCAYPAFVSRDPVPTLDQLIDHAVYISELVGAQHVGLGLDFADEDENDYDYFGYDERYYPRPPWTWPAGISWWEDAANIAPALRRCGFSDEDVTDIMGEHFMRAFEQTWDR